MIEIVKYFKEASIREFVVGLILAAVIIRWVYDILKGDPK